MTWTIYWLSVVDSLKGTMIGICIVLGVTLLFAGMGMVIEPDVKITSRLAKFFKPAFIVLGIATIIAAFTPTKRDIVEAYLMIEGSKVVNVETTEKVATAASARIDRFLGALEKKWISEDKAQP